MVGRDRRFESTAGGADLHIVSILREIYVVIMSLFQSSYELNSIIQRLDQLTHKIFLFVSLRVVSNRRQIAIKCFQE